MDAWGQRSHRSRLWEECACRMWVVQALAWAQYAFLGENVYVHMTNGVRACVCAGECVYLCMQVLLGVRQTPGISTRLPTLIILQVWMNEFLPIDHISSESTKVVWGGVHRGAFISAVCWWTAQTKACTEWDMIKKKRDNISDNFLCVNFPVRICIVHAEWTTLDLENCVAPVHHNVLVLLGPIPQSLTVSYHFGFLFSCFKSQLRFRKLWNESFRKL